VRIAIAVARCARRAAVDDRRGRSRAHDSDPCFPHASFYARRDHSNMRLFERDASPNPTCCECSRTRSRTSRDPRAYRRSCSSRTTELWADAHEVADLQGETRDPLDVEAPRARPVHMLANVDQRNVRICLAEKIAQVIRVRSEPGVRYHDCPEVEPRLIDLGDRFEWRADLDDHESGRAKRSGDQLAAPACAIDEQDARQLHALERGQQLVLDEVLELRRNDEQLDHERSAGSPRVDAYYRSDQVQPAAEPVEPNIETHGCPDIGYRRGIIDQQAQPPDREIEDPRVGGEGPVYDRRACRPDATAFPAVGSGR